jgi:lysozyme
MRKVIIAVGVAGGALGAYWLYLYEQDVSNVPTLSDLFDNLKSYFTRSSLIATGEIASLGGALGVSSSGYFSIAEGFIAKQESFSPRVYNDAGKQAIGYGHDLVPGDGFDSNSVIDESTGRQLLDSDMQSFDDCISSNVQVPLSDNQRAALLSFIYNIGCQAFRTSTMLQKLNSGDYSGADQEFYRWVYAFDSSQQAKVVNQDLVARRSAESDLFNT